MIALWPWVRCVDWRFVRKVLLQSFSDAYWMALALGAMLSAVYLASLADPQAYQDALAQLGVRSNPLIQAWGQDVSPLFHLCVVLLPALKMFIANISTRWDGDDD